MYGGGACVLLVITIMVAVVMSEPLQHGNTFLDPVFQANVSVCFSDGNFFSALTDAIVYWVAMLMGKFAHMFSLFVGLPVK
jgi:hypothetical protein